MLKAYRHLTESLYKETVYINYNIRYIFIHVKSCMYYEFMTKLRTIFFIPLLRLDNCETFNASTSLIVQNFVSVNVLIECPELSLTERQFVGRNCRVHFYVHIPPKVSGSGKALLNCYIYHF